jgi:hypothetical protein
MPLPVAYANLLQNQLPLEFVDHDLSALLLHKLALLTVTAAASKRHHLSINYHGQRKPQIYIT